MSQESHIRRSSLSKESLYLPQCIQVLHQICPKKNIFVPKQAGRSPNKHFFAQKKSFLTPKKASFAQKKKHFFAQKKALFNAK